jgi:UDP-glucuronate 4-epimerase
MGGHALVTGAAGFIGSSLVDRLLCAGWTVTAIDNFDPFYSPIRKRMNIADHLQCNAYRLIEADILDLSRLRASVNGSYDVLVHLAAKAGVRPSIAHPREYTDVNVVGTQNILELARERKIRQVVFASSSSVYGVNPNVPWREEDHVLLPISPYAGTKVSGELLGHIYSRLFEIRFVALRFFTAYGPRQRPDLAIHKFAALLSQGLPVTIFGDGSTKRDYTYVTDIVEGIVSAMMYCGTPYEVINIGNNNTIPLHEVVHTLGVMLNKSVKVHRVPEQPGDVRQTWADVSKAGRLLNYRPTTPFREGARLFVDWYANVSSSMYAFERASGAVNR